MDYIIPVYIDHGIDSMGMTGSSALPHKDKPNHYKNIVKTQLPKSKKINTVSYDISIYQAFYDYDIGHIVIKSKKRKDAYDIAMIIRFYLSVFMGWQSDDQKVNYFLQELKKLPQPSWDNDKMKSELNEIKYQYPIDDILLFDLQNGISLPFDILQGLIKFIDFAWDKDDLINAMNHLLESSFLFYGFMVSSYYSSHYKPDRLYLPKWELEKRYYENRYRYESAFIAAFKGIESFFGVNDIKKHEINKVINNSHFKFIKPTDIYKRYHEIFSGFKETIQYHEIIDHFLKYRNIVAAHGNKKPPKEYELNEDNIYEIQLFLTGLISRVYHEFKTAQ
ncbi:hypothetical protein MEO93_24650 [Dolichospermum sp. ST_sed3]|nr:hypothetical protein [Dolichospermum sp. ST_sed3]